MLSYILYGNAAIQHKGKTAVNSWLPEAETAALFTPASEDFRGNKYDTKIANAYRKFSKPYPPQ
jgi:hypothetical protein